MNLERFKFYTLRNIPVGQRTIFRWELEFVPPSSCSNSRQIWVRLKLWYYSTFKRIVLEGEFRDAFCREFWNLLVSRIKFRRISFTRFKLPGVLKKFPRTFHHSILGTLQHSLYIRLKQIILLLPVLRILKIIIYYTNIKN